ncbi:MAG: hypothetical protein AAFQ54_07380 [Pseudomonadota bacterium]
MALVLFGCFGIAISILEGVRPFLNVSRFVSWLTNYFRVHIPEDIILLLAKFEVDLSRFQIEVFWASLCWFSAVIGFRIKSPHYFRAYAPIQAWLNSRASFMSNLAAFFTWVLLPSILVFALFFAVPTFALTFYSITLSFGAACVIFRALFRIRLDAIVLGEIPEDYTRDFSDAGPGSQAFHIYTLMVSMAVSILIVINEIGVQADNIEAAWSALLCSAGIEC